MLVSLMNDMNYDATLLQFAIFHDCRAVFTSSCMECSIKKTVAISVWSNPGMAKIKPFFVGAGATMGCVFVNF